MRSATSSVAAIAARNMPRRAPRPARCVLNIGSGRTGRLHAGFDARRWDEIRLDIDPAVRPDIVGSLLDMEVADASVDAVWCSHVLEHLHGHEVVPALSECRRVLRQDGFALVTSPDLMAVAQRVVNGGIEATAYVSPAGPITTLDMLFGHSASVAAGNTYMAHRTGFTADRLGRLATEAGFSQARVAHGTAYDLWALLLMPRADVRSIEATFAKTNVIDVLF